MRVSGLRQSQLDLLRRLVAISNDLVREALSYEFIVSTTMEGTSVDFLYCTGPRNSMDGISTSDINELYSRGFLRLVRIGTHGDRNYEVRNRAFELFREDELSDVASHPGPFRTGDAQLDALLESALTKYKLADAEAHREALEKIWDAWERLKSLEAAGRGEKRRSIKALLMQAAPEARFRAHVETDAEELTKIGNHFNIRHSETYNDAVTDPHQVDYLFERMLALVRLLLRKSERA